MKTLYNSQTEILFDKFGLKLLKTPANARNKAWLYMVDNEPKVVFQTLVDAKQKKRRIRH